MSTINKIDGLEILDSRGRPTVKATVTLANGIRAQASVPSGASTGSAEAIELRDGDKERYNGMGCQNAIHNIQLEIHPMLSGKAFEHVFSLDKALITLDGTPNKSRLGANAILAVSIAFARAQSMESGVPFYRYLADCLNRSIDFLPRLTINLFSGGLHAGGIVPIQDSLIVPVSANSIDQSLSMAASVYQSAVGLSLQKFNMRPLTADEGGLSPNFTNADQMLALTLEAIERAGLQPGQDMAMALDVAATHFYSHQGYRIHEQDLSSRQMISKLEEWLTKYPILSLEDGLAEDDWEHWPELLNRCRGKAIVMGDDLLCTHIDRIARAVQSNAANALLLKVNQIGTLYEASLAIRKARDAKWTITISARSGETEDDWLADLAVGWGGDYIKIGSINQSERLSKYNRLLEIEKETGLPLKELPQVL
ncbi:MAG TPA: phosphopyruvate hydratase [Verrucomicrobiales bacterium]|nr:phosphopyruvate hydratase [Verrucomicrobiales bacterium]